MARTIVGTVVSDKADKTIVLSVTVRKTHPIYKKQYSRSTKYIAHDENNDAKTGDVVEVEETRPISARKRMKLVRVIEKAAITADKTVEAITAQDAGSEAAIQEKKAAKEAQAKAEAEKAAAEAKEGEA
jgi:small subunit ribosomal protein S17